MKAHECLRVCTASHFEVIWSGRGLARLVEQHSQRGMRGERLPLHP